MSRINFAHIRERTVNGHYIDFAVFEADASSGTNEGRSRLLAQLTARARASGLKIDASALAYEEYGTINFYGSRNVVDWLADSELPPWTHTLDI